MKYATVAQSYTPKKTLVTSNNAEPQKNSASQLQEIRMAYETSCDLKKKMEIRKQPLYLQLHEIHLVFMESDFKQ